MNVDTLSMSTQEAAPPEDSAEYYQQYKSLSKAAVGSLVFGLLSWVSMMDWLLLAIPAVGVVLGLFARRQIRKRPRELSGAPLAQLGLVLSMCGLLGGGSYLGYDYLTEVPEGYDLISYSQLQPDPEHPSQMIPASAQSLDGQRVFIRGYVYPSNNTRVHEFILCRDQGDCCFGGNPKLTDRIQVTLDGDLMMDFSPKLLRVGGVFHIQPGYTPAVAGGVIYRMNADYLR